MRFNLERGRTLLRLEHILISRLFEERSNPTLLEGSMAKKLSSMRFIAFLLALIITSLAPMPVVADDRAEMFDMAETFAKCSGVFRVMSLATTGASSEQDKQLANGARVASFYIGRSLGLSDAVAFTDNLVETEVTGWLANMEVNPEAMANSFEPEYKKCMALLPIQDDIIKQARRDAYSQ